ncbi:MAG: hypothetical protein ACTSVI_00980 [Promethearchaeota archaeon]
MKEPCKQLTTRKCQEYQENISRQHYEKSTAIMKIFYPRYSRELEKNNIL